MTSSVAKTATGVETQRELFEIADRVLPGSGLGSYSLADDIRLIYSHGKGSRMWDVDENEYIDYVGGAGALILGHSHPEIVATVHDAIAELDQVHSSFLSEPALRLASGLKKIYVRADPAKIRSIERISYAM